MNKLSSLPNIGKETEKQLNEVGILSAEHLIKTGSKQAWLKIKEIDHQLVFTGCMGLKALFAA